MFGLFKKSVSWQDLQAVFLSTLKAMYRRSSEIPGHLDLERAVIGALSSRGYKLSQEKELLLKVACVGIEMGGPELQQHLAALARGDDSAAIEILHRLELQGAGFGSAVGPDEMMRKIFDGKL